MHRSNSMTLSNFWNIYCNGLIMDAMYLGTGRHGISSRGKLGAIRAHCIFAYNRGYLMGCRVSVWMTQCRSGISKDCYMRYGLQLNLSALCGIDLKSCLLAHTRTSSHARFLWRSSCRSSVLLRGAGSSGSPTYLSQPSCMLEPPRLQAIIVHYCLSAVVRAWVQCKGCTTWMMKVWLMYCLGTPSMYCKMLMF